MTISLVYSVLKELFFLFVMFKAVKFFRSFDEAKAMYESNNTIARRAAESGHKQRVGSSSPYDPSCGRCHTYNTTVKRSWREGDTNFVELRCGDCRESTVKTF